MEQAPETSMPESPLAHELSPTAAIGDDVGFWEEDEAEQQAADALLAPSHSTTESPTEPAETAGALPTSGGDQAELSGDSPILNIPFADGDEAEEGWGDDDLPTDDTELGAETAQSEHADAVTQVLLLHTALYIMHLYFAYSTWCESHFLAAAFMYEPPSAR